MMLWFVGRHPRVPFLPRLLVVVTVAYAFSPIDLIPDFIPVLGYLDELVLLPLAIYLTLKLIPDDVLAECRAQSEAYLGQPRSRPRSYAAAVVIVLLWVLALLLLWRWIGPWLTSDSGEVRPRPS